MWWVVFNPHMGRSPEEVSAADSSPGPPEEVAVAKGPGCSAADSPPGRLCRSPEEASVAKGPGCSAADSQNYFNIPNDFTPEEEAEVRLENAWAEEQVCSSEASA